MDNSLTKRFGAITILLIVITGLLACFDLYSKLNIKNAIYGYFYSEPEVIQINDFEYDVKNLLFVNTGVDNQYKAEVNAKAVTGFDKSKTYTATINGSYCSPTTANSDYINVLFVNQFYSTSDAVILTDELNIKINFYKEGTKIVFITNNGEKAVKLWTSFIVKNGFNLKIVECDYSSSIQIEGLRRISYVVDIQDEGYYRTARHVDYIPLNQEYTIKSISEITSIFDDVNYKFYGWTTNKSDLEDPITCCSLTGTITPTDDIVYWGLVLDKETDVTNYKNGILMIDIVYDSETLSPTTAYGIVKIQSRSTTGDTKTWTLALKEKCYTIENLHRINYVISVVKTAAILPINDITVTFDQQRVQKVTIHVVADPNNTSTVTSN